MCRIRCDESHNVILAKARGLLWVQGQYAPNSESEASPGYRMRLYLEKKKSQQEKKLRR